MRGDAHYLSEIRERLYTAVLSDVLDELGFRHQAMPPSIRPLDDSLVLAGFARTGSYREVYRVVPDENPYELEMALIEVVQGEARPPATVIVQAAAVTASAPVVATVAAAPLSIACLTRRCSESAETMAVMAFP